MKNQYHIRFTNEIDAAYEYTIADAAGLQRAALDAKQKIMQDKRTVRMGFLHGQVWYAVTWSADHALGIPIDDVIQNAAHAWNRLLDRVAMASDIDNMAGDLGVAVSDKLTKIAKADRAEKKSKFHIVKE